MTRAMPAFRGCAGVRVIYYWAVAHDVLLMLYLYPKSVRNRLTKDQEHALAALAEREFG